MSYNSSDPGPVPDRWLLCPRKSVSLIAEKFLAFKTPLSSRFDSKVSPTHRFTPTMLLDSTRNYGYRIGLWIDLTNTNRFYDKKEVEEGYDGLEEVRYVKMKCRGHKEAPSDEQITVFNTVCSTFIQNEPRHAIGVHCTHGFNRTGFLIICFLVEKQDWGLEAAINEFAKARTPGIYKQDYIDALYMRYEPESIPAIAPPRPAWCLGHDDGPGEPEQQEHTSNGRRGDKRKNMSKGERFSKRHNHNGEGKIPQFTEEIDKVEPVLKQEIIRRVQSAAQKMCHWDRGGFPGSQPVSMDLVNISKLSENPYYVSWKADGTRYMMVILDKDEVYMIDRDNSVFEVSGLQFVNRKDFKKHLVNTLLDGEMVIDRFHGGNIPRYLIYDVICVNGQDISPFRFEPERRLVIQKDIIEPRHKAMELGIINKSEEPFSVREKIFSPVYDAAKYLGEKFSNQLTHEPDGLIFQPCREPYVPGPSPKVLKWKPPSHNSIDFRLKIEKEEGMGIVSKKVGNLYVGGQTPLFGQIKYTKDLEQYHDKIIECRLEKNKWIFMRERTDKSFPNSLKTARSVMNSIKNPVTKEFLLSYIEHHKYMKTDSDVMPPPPARKR